MNNKDGKPKVIIVSGLTATGKTRLAYDIAREFNGELVNCDSRQIYKYLDIGTNKENFKDITLHLTDLIEPSDRFSLYEYQKLAYKKIDEIIERKKIPIVVGGTGLYIDSIVKNYNLTETKVSHRAQLEKLKLDQLQNIVEKSFEKDLISNSDWYNKRRLIRFIEKQGVTNLPNNELRYDFLHIYTKYEWEQLKQTIDARVIYMFDNGIVEETKKVLAMGFLPTDLGLKIMGYKEVVQYLEGKISEDECIKLVQTAHKQYARRQRTWFESGGRKYNLKRVSGIEQARSIINSFLTIGGNSDRF